MYIENQYTFLKTMNISYNKHLGVSLQNQLEGPQWELSVDGIKHDFKCFYRLVAAGQW